MGAVKVGSGKRYKFAAQGECRIFTEGNEGLPEFKHPEKRLENPAFRAPVPRAKTRETGRRHSILRVIFPRMRQDRGVRE